MGKKKLTEAQFWKYLKASNCLYSVAAEMISQVEKINYSRQAVRQRAEKKAMYRTVRATTAHHASCSDLMFLMHFIAKSRLPHAKDDGCFKSSVHAQR